MIGVLVGAVLSPLLKLGERYLDNQKDKERLKAATEQIAINADASVRPSKWSHWMGRLPLFVAEVTAVAYFASILVDSTFPTDLVNPLKLPQWFEPYFGWTMSSVLGIAAMDRWFGRK